MLLHRIIVPSCLALSALGWACSGRTPSPTAPTLAVPTSSRVFSDEQGEGAHIASTHGQPLTAVIGAGSGIVNVTLTAAGNGSLSSLTTVDIHGAPPNTTFYVQRAGELGRGPTGFDGICQRAAGLPPWGPPTPNFLTYPLPQPGPLVTLETSPGGAGAVTIPFASSAVASTTRFDVMVRLVDSLTDPANELRTSCFTVEVK
jgi:hypothetical protein